jgi:large subunit ribosomal protein L13
MSTQIAKENEVIRDWFVVDINNQVLGRIASEIATVLRGKHKAIYSPSVDTGDFVVVVNADKVKLTGHKVADKTYYHHSGFPGGIKSITAEKLLEKRPEDLIKKAVKGMLPKNRLGRQLIKKLKIYSGTDHPHAAQQPKTLSF